MVEKWECEWEEQKMEGPELHLWAHSVDLVTPLDPRSKGQFQIKQWHSNNKKVDQTDEEHVDFLGNKWNKVRDTITFKKTEIVEIEAC